MKSILVSFGCFYNPQADEVRKTMHPDHNIVSSLQKNDDGRSLIDFVLYYDLTTDLRNTFIVSMNGKFPLSDLVKSLEESNSAPRNNYEKALNYFAMNAESPNDIATRRANVKMDDSSLKDSWSMRVRPRDERTASIDIYMQ